MNLEGAYPRKQPKLPKKPNHLATVGWVTVIVFVYTTFIAPPVLGRSSNGKDSTAKSDISTLSSLVQQFRRDCGRYPTNEEGLQALRTEPAQVTGWKGPYLNHEIPLNPWGQPYRYQQIGLLGKAFIIESFPNDQNDRDDQFYMWDKGHA